MRDIVMALIGVVLLWAVLEINSNTLEIYARQQRDIVQNREIMRLQEDVKSLDLLTARHMVIIDRLNRATTVLLEGEQP